MATWQEISTWLVDRLSAREEGSALSVVVGDHLVLVFPPDDDQPKKARLVAPLVAASQTTDRRLAARLVDEGGLVEHNRRYYLQAPVSIERLTPTGIAGAVVGFGRSAGTIHRALVTSAPMPVEPMWNCYVD
jgi:hypothetical protein